jgi:hypothetical protein
MGIPGEVGMFDRKETKEFHVVWFPPDTPRRIVKRSTFEAARDYVEENDLADYAPLIEEVHVIMQQSRRLVWNGATQP